MVLPLSLPLFSTLPPSPALPLSPTLFPFPHPSPSHPSAPSFVPLSPFWWEEEGRAWAEAGERRRGERGRGGRGDGGGRGAEERGRGGWEGTQILLTSLVAQGDGGGGEGSQVKRRGQIGRENGVREAGTAKSNQSIVCERRLMYPACAPVSFLLHYSARLGMVTQKNQTERSPKSDFSPK